MAETQPTQTNQTNQNIERQIVTVGNIYCRSCGYYRKVRVYGHWTIPTYYERHDYNSSDRTERYVFETSNPAYVVVHEMGTNGRISHTVTLYIVEKGEEVARFKLRDDDYPMNAIPLSSLLQRVQLPYFVIKEIERLLSLPSE